MVDATVATGTSDLEDCVDLERVLAANGVSVTPLRAVSIGTLRYFEPAGDFVDVLSRLAGGRLPAAGEVLRCPCAGAGELVLAADHPLELLVMSESRTAFESLAGGVHGRGDGCLVELSGGLWGCAIAGPRARDLLVRLGSDAVVPAHGQCRSGRLAEVAVTALCLDPGEIRLLVDRVYAHHLQAWIEATLADF